ncbi:MAG: type III secretion system chaperone [Victivallales bacterium]|nr:type III secretion system chaperone [Victivallales bacterium]
MTEHLTRLADLAASFTSPKDISTDELGFTVDVAGVPLTFFVPDGFAASAYCRALVASLDKAALPGKFAEAALRGNFFWRATNGATISLNESENAIYLTDRFDEAAFEDSQALSAYIDEFLTVLRSWKNRLDACLPPADTKEARP